MRILLLSLTALLVAGQGAPRAPEASAPVASPPTVVLLVRHAEKAAQPQQDPPLTNAGAARARALVDVARDARVTAIITTQVVRTRKTAEPTATALHLTPKVIDVDSDSIPQHVKAVAEEIRKHAGGTVLVVGHSNTIPAIVGALGAPQPKNLCESEYDRLFVVVIGDTGPPRLVRSRYGVVSATDSSCPAMQSR